VGFSSQLDISVRAFFPQLLTCHRFNRATWQSSWQELLLKLNLNKVRVNIFINIFMHTISTKLINANDPKICRLRKYLKIPESVRTDNTMVKRKATKGQITIYKTLHTKINIEQYVPHIKTNRGWTQVPRKCKQFLLYMWHPSCYSCYKPDVKLWIRKGRCSDYDKRNTEIRGDLWYRFP
jgi:hypothetical protein